MPQEGPIVPSHSDAWIYFRHSDTDLGDRRPGFNEHNEKYESSVADGTVTIRFELANSGWADASLVCIDLFVPSGPDWVVLSHDDQTIPSGEIRRAKYTYTAGPDYAEDGAPTVTIPAVALRATTLTTLAPSRREILRCLRMLSTDWAAAIAQLRDWKRVPGFFVYPCCALFPPPVAATALVAKQAKRATARAPRAKAAGRR